MLFKKFGETFSSVQKKYVATPQREWLKNSSIHREILERVNEGYLHTNRIINFQKFQKDYDDYINTKELGNSFFVWKVLNLELLCQQFCKG